MFKSVVKIDGTSLMRQLIKTTSQGVIQRYKASCWCSQAAAPQPRAHTLPQCLALPYSASFNAPRQAPLVRLRSFQLAPLVPRSASLCCALPRSAVLYLALSAQPPTCLRPSSRYSVQLPSWPLGRCQLHYTLNSPRSDSVGLIVPRYCASLPRCA